MRSVLIRVKYNKDGVFFFVKEHSSREVELIKNNDFYEIDDFISCTKPVFSNNQIDGGAYSTSINIEEQSILYSVFILFYGIINYASQMGYSKVVFLNRTIQEKLSEFIKDIEKIK